MVNYPDNGVPVYLADGTFYREIRVVKKTNTTTLSLKWLPFNPPSGHVPSTKQLNRLLEKLVADQTYLFAFYPSSPLPPIQARTRAPYCPSSDDRWLWSTLNGPSS